MNKRHLVIAGGVIILIIGWALFRPELLFFDKSVNESFPGDSMPTAHVAAAAVPAASPQTMTLRSGAFHSVAHETRGTASIHQLSDGKRVLRFTGFETSNGPVVRVLLVAADDASDNDTVKNGMPIELGKLKGNIGDQNYEIPAGADLGKYKAVTIWCHRFSVNFATAPLM